MPEHVRRPSLTEAAGNLPKRIGEFAGGVRTGHASASVSRMVSPKRWQEPGQTPESEAITVMLRGALTVEHARGAFVVRAGEAAEKPLA